MSAAAQSASNPRPQGSWRLSSSGTYDGLRVLAWTGKILYASRGFSLLRARPELEGWEWETVAGYRPAPWRKMIEGSRPLSRLVRNGFHALCSTCCGHLIAAVPGAILTLHPAESEFRPSHRIIRGTRPLHFCVTPDDVVLWGEYFDNPHREPVHIYASSDHGESWHVAYTFPAGSIRHVHNIVYDQRRKCLWIATGDDGGECRILRASSSLDQVSPMLIGSQQTRAAALLPTPEGLFFSSDTPFEKNYVYCLDDADKVRTVVSLNSSSIFGCAVGSTLFFSTMVEPSKVNRELSARLYGGHARSWRQLQGWEKDIWPAGLFQYGNVILPDGQNDTNLLAVTTIAVKDADLRTYMWRVESAE